MQTLTEEGGRPPADQRCTASRTSRFAVHIAQILHCFPPVAPHWSSLVISEGSLEVCKFYTLSFSLKSSWPKNGLFLLSARYAGQACLKVWVFTEFPPALIKYSGILALAFFLQFFSCEIKKLQPSSSTKLVFFIMQASLYLICNLNKRCLHSAGQKENTVYPNHSPGAED